MDPEEQRRALRKIRLGLTIAGIGVALQLIALIGQLIAR